MTLQDPVSDPDQDQLPVLVNNCQQNFAKWQSALDPEQQRMARDQHRVWLERLWNALAADLHGVARGWLRSGMAPDTDSLAMSMFVHIMTALPKLQIDPQKNVRKFLLTIARRGMIDEYRRSYGSGPRRQPKTAAPDPAGARETRMWPATASAAAPPIDQPTDPADPDSFDAENRVARQLDQEAILRAVWSYWPTTLSAEDLQIMQLRWQEEPPLSFRDIARQMGPGWEEDTVRQRHHRVIKDTRRFLREQGLIDDASPI